MARTRNGERAIHWTSISLSVGRSFCATLGSGRPTSASSSAAVAMTSSERVAARGAVQEVAEGVLAEEVEVAGRA